MWKVGTFFVAAEFCSAAVLLKEVLFFERARHSRDLMLVIGILKNEEFGILLDESVIFIEYL